MFFFFGCIDKPGHCLWEPPDHSTNFRIHALPWGREIDDGLVPKFGGQDWAAIHHKDGWTAVSFRDYSVDTRPGSNGSFIADGEFTFEEMMKRAEREFPAVFKRIGPIRLVGSVSTPHPSKDEAPETPEKFPERN